MLMLGEGGGGVKYTTFVVLTKLLFKNKQIQARKIESLNIWFTPETNTMRHIY